MISRIFIQRPVLSTVLAFLILLVGFQGLFGLKVREYPEVEETVITITTTYAGASADLMQGFVTAPIAEAVATTENVNYIMGKSGIELVRAAEEIMARFQPDKLPQ